jgi:hypothetical protein
MSLPVCRGLNCRCSTGCEPIEGEASAPIFPSLTSRGSTARYSFGCWIDGRCLNKVVARRHFGSDGPICIRIGEVLTSDHRTACSAVDVNGASSDIDVADVSFQIAHGCRWEPGISIGERYRDELLLGHWR